MALAKKSDFGFTKLLVADLERCLAFYKSVAGLEESGRVDADIAGRKISEFLLQPTTPGGASLVLLHFHDRARPSADEVILGFITADLDAFVKRTREAGGSVYEEIKPMPEHGVRVAFVKDPESGGAVIGSARSPRSRLPFRRVFAPRARAPGEAPGCRSRGR